MSWKFSQLYLYITVVRGVTQNKWTHVNKVLFSGTESTVGYYWLHILKEFMEYACSLIHYVQGWLWSCQSTKVSQAVGFLFPRK